MIETGPLFKEIGLLIAAHLGVQTEGSFLYAEVEDDMVGFAIFADGKDRVLYKSPPGELGPIIYKIWLAEKPENRWFSFTYVIKNNSFDVSFKFADEVDLEEEFEDRREHEAAKIFPDREIDWSDGNR
jgi:hypothetical protein